MLHKYHLVSGFSEVLQCVRTTEGKKRKPQGSEKIQTWQIYEKKQYKQKKTPGTFMARNKEIYQEKLANIQRKNGTSRRKVYENKLANFQVKKLWEKKWKKICNFVGKIGKFTRQTGQNKN